MLNVFRDRVQIHSLMAVSALSLGLLHDRGALPEKWRELAIKVLSSEVKETWNPETRSYMALGLGLLSATEHEETLRRYLRQQEEVELLVPAAMGLTLMGSRDTAIEDILKSLERVSNEFILQSLAYALGKIGDARAIPALRALLDGRRPGTKNKALRGSRIDYVRGYAAVALGMILDPEETPAISRLQTHFNYVSDPFYWEDLLKML